MDQTLPMPEASNTQSGLDDENDFQDVADQQSEVEEITPVDVHSHTVQTLLSAAAELAGSRGHTVVTTDDLFAAVLTIDCAASRTLDEIDMQRESLLDQLAFILGRNNGGAASQASDISPRVERVLENARLDAGRRGASAVDSLHLLSALLRERSGVPSLLLETPGLGLEPVGAALNRALREGATDPS